MPPGLLLLLLLLYLYYDNILLILKSEHFLDEAKDDLHGGMGHLDLDVTEVEVQGLEALEEVGEDQGRQRLGRVVKPNRVEDQEGGGVVD